MIQVIKFLIMNIQFSKFNYDFIYVFNNILFLIFIGSNTIQMLYTVTFDAKN